MAKALIYPRVLGTSISTTFGMRLQYFCNEVLSSYASTTSGIYIEFVDAVDGRRKYCQVKEGPTTINHNDVDTIKRHFYLIRNLLRTNHLKLNITDCIVEVFYGTESVLSQSYKRIAEEYPVYVRRELNKSSKNGQWKKHPLYGSIKIAIIKGVYAKRILTYTAIRRRNVETKRRRINKKEIGERLGLSFEQVKGCLKRYRKRQAKMEAGIALKRKGRPPNNYVVSEQDNVAELKYLLA